METEGPPAGLKGMGGLISPPSNPDTISLSHRAFPDYSYLLLQPQSPVLLSSLAWSSRAGSLPSCTEAGPGAGEVAVELAIRVWTLQGRSFHDRLQGHHTTNRTHLPQLRGEAASQRTLCRSRLCGDLVPGEAALDSTPLMKRHLYRSVPKAAVAMYIITEAGCGLHIQEQRMGTGERSLSHNRTPCGGKHDIHAEF